MGIIMMRDLILLLRIKLEIFNIRAAEKAEMKKAKKTLEQTTDPQEKERLEEKNG